MGIVAPLMGDRSKKYFAEGPLSHFRITAGAFGDEPPNPIAVYRWYAHEMHRPDIDLALISAVGSGLFAARGALECGTPYVLVMPWIGYKPHWKLERMFKDVLWGCVHVHYVSHANYMSGPSIIKNTNKFIVDNVDQVFTAGRVDDYATLTRIPNLRYDFYTGKSAWEDYLKIDRPKDQDYPMYMTGLPG